MRGFPFSARAVALAATFLAGSAYAATPEDADKGAGAPVQAAPAAGQDDGEIIVTTTAQKRFENIQNVPLAV